MMGKQLPKFCELITCPWHHLHLLQQGRDSDPATITRMHLEALTDAGRKAWADVLQARAVCVRPGHFGVEVILEEGVPIERIDAFTHMLAGINLPEQYEQWVAEDYQGAN